MEEKLDKHIERFEEHERMEFEHHAKQQQQIDELKTMVAPIADIHIAILGTGKTLTVVGKVIRWVVLTGGAIGIIWGFIQHGPHK